MRQFGHGCLPCVWSRGTGGVGSVHRFQHEFCKILRLGSAAQLNLVEFGRYGCEHTNVLDFPSIAGVIRGRDELLKTHPQSNPG